MLKSVVISGKKSVATEVIIEPFAQVFSIPPDGLMEIVIDGIEERVEINLRDDGGVTVWLFEAGEISISDRATLDAYSARRRRINAAEPKALDDVVKQLRSYARREAEKDCPPEERDAAANRMKLLELTRDLLKRGQPLPNDLKSELLAWGLVEERLPMREVFVGYLRAAVELGSG